MRTCPCHQHRLHRQHHPHASHHGLQPCHVGSTAFTAFTVVSASISVGILAVNLGDLGLLAVNNLGDLGLPRSCHSLMMG